MRLALGRRALVIGRVATRRVTRGVTRARVRRATRASTAHARGAAASLLVAALHSANSHACVSDAWAAARAALEDCAATAALDTALALVLAAALRHLSS